MPDTRWLADARWGVFFHFLADQASTQAATSLAMDEWNKRVDAFNVDALADQLVDACVLAWSARK
jgi:hypothetical protein